MGKKLSAAQQKRRERARKTKERKIQSKIRAEKKKKDAEQRRIDAETELAIIHCAGGELIHPECKFRVIDNSNECGDGASIPQPPRELKIVLKERDDTFNQILNEIDLPGIVWQTLMGNQQLRHMYVRTQEWKEEVKRDFYRNKEH